MYHCYCCSVAELCTSLCNPMDCSPLGFPVFHHLPDLVQTHVYWVMPSKHLILCHPLPLLPSIFPGIRVFSNESALCIRWQSIGTAASAPALLMNIQDWFPLGLTGLISLQSKVGWWFFWQLTAQVSPWNPANGEAFAEPWRGEWEASLQSQLQLFFNQVSPGTKPRG